MTYQAFEENDISIKANGGTELSKRGVASRLPSDLVDNFQIICSRPRELLSDKIRILWHHDLPNDQEVSHLREPASRARFHHHVFVSNWQQQQYWQMLGFPADENSSVIENPIEPLEFNAFRFCTPDTINLVYASTPHRGLKLLVPVFEQLAEFYPRIRLHVFSSFKMYGWDNADDNFRDLFARIDAHPLMTNHGFQPNNVVRKQLESSHILAYPNIWPETSCRVLIEAMSAGLTCVHPNLAALAETSGGLTQMYPFCINEVEHARVFKVQLGLAIREMMKEKLWDPTRALPVRAANHRFSYDAIVPKWQALLEKLVFNYPVVQSRAAPQQMFTYTTG